MKTALIAAIVLTLAISVAAQNPQPTSPASKPVQASAQNPVLVIDKHTLDEHLGQLLPEASSKGSAGATLVDYGSYKIQLSMRTEMGGAEVHAHWDDVMTVERGSATLITGGTVVDGKTGEDGETHGSRIEGGQSQPINPGDVLTIRAGTPHQLILKPGTIYGAVVVKIHEP
jgi:mannose-6-phosphate isomerase-like protein (cupin superfamily)